MTGRLLAITLGIVTATPHSALTQSVQYRSAAGIEYRSKGDTGTIARAVKALATEPNNVDLILALGLAQAGMSQYQEAIATFSQGLRVAPQNTVLLRWRGHRLLSLRQFDQAKADLERAATLDPKLYGAWYHLGVVRFALGEFAGAAEAFARAQPIAPEAGELAGSTDWLWMSLARAGRLAEGKTMIDRRPDSLPTAVAYARRLRLYRGEIGPEALVTPADSDGVTIATLSFGLGNWYLVKGDTAQAKTWFRRAVAVFRSW